VTGILPNMTEDEKAFLKMSKKKKEKIKAAQEKAS
jgi:hypothetical protein